MAGGVKGQQLGADPFWERLLTEPLHQLPGGGAVGLGQIGAQILGLNGKVGQRAGALHQRAAKKGAARPVHSQGQLGGRRFGVKLPRSVHNQAGHAVLKQSGFPSHPHEHANILQIDSHIPKWEGKQQSLPRKAVQFLRPAEGADLYSFQRIAQHLRKAHVRPGGIGGGVDDNQGHQDTFLQNGL